MTNDVKGIRVGFKILPNHISPEELLDTGAFHAAGVHLQPFETGQQFGLGLLFFVDPGRELVDMLRSLRALGIDRVITISTAKQRPSDKIVWELLREGASDVLIWRDREEFAATICARVFRWQSIDRIVGSPLVREHLVGSSPTWTDALRQVVEVAAFTEESVLIAGESGTGKELVARLIHTLDRRPDKGQLVVLDCTTIVPELAGSELFGHEKGSFTNALSGRAGAFEIADKGTLFLDEIGELHPPLQAELLRAVQERTYKRVGSNTWHTTNCRLICATNRDLLANDTGRPFRQDLYFRIATWTIGLPPLRNRREDIIRLAKHFLQEVSPSREPPEIDEAVQSFLISREYKGNVRELRNLIRRMAWRHVPGGPITAGDIPEEHRPLESLFELDDDFESLHHAVRTALARGLGLKEISRDAADAAVDIAIRETGGNLKLAAKKLHVSVRALQLRRANSRPIDWSTSLGRTHRIEA